MAKMTLLNILGQQVEHFPAAVVSPRVLEDRLNARGADGWTLQGVTVMVTRKGGSAFVARSAYYLDDLTLLFSRTNRRHLFRVVMLEREPTPAVDMAQLNRVIDEQNARGFELVQLTHLSAIGDRPERPTAGTVAHMAIFTRPGRFLTKEVGDAATA